jgi:uncharacterized protein (DUF305 family)
MERDHPMNRTVRTNRIIRSLALPAALASALAVSACGSSSDTPASSSHSGMSGMGSTTSSSPTGTGSSAGTSHNAADATFTMSMIPHHQQAVEMAGLAATRAKSTRVKDLAGKIAGEQQPEITMMNGWLKDWGMPAMASGSSGQMDHMGEGMMSSADMAKLKDLRGSAFDRQFLTMMIAHHKGAITMAQTEQTGGSNAAAKKLAGSIVTGQSAEITMMSSFLAGAS